MQARLDVGGVIGRVWSIYVDQASVLMPAAAAVFVVTGVVSAVLVLASPVLALVAIALDLVAGTLFTGMVVSFEAAQNAVSYGISNLVGGAVTFTTSRELGPMLSAVVVGKVGDVLP